MNSTMENEAHSISGLTSAEVAERVSAGKVNSNADVKTKTIGQIFAGHALTLFNAAVSRRRYTS